MIAMVEPPLSIVCRIESEGADGGSVDEHRTDELGELVVDAPTFPVRITADFPGGSYCHPLDHRLILAMLAARRCALAVTAWRDASPTRRPPVSLRRS